MTTTATVSLPAPQVNSSAPPGAFNPVELGLGTLVPVLGAHPQAGASGIALALADAAAMCGLRVLLIDCADPARSGLAGIAGVEGRSLSVSADKAPVRLASRLLTRGAVATRRLVGDGSPLAVSAVPQPLAWAAADHNDFDVTVVDLGWDVWSLMAPSGRLGPLAWCTATPAVTFPVLVFRPTAGSVVLAEGLLTRYGIGTQMLGLAGLHGAVAVGADTWPRPALVSMGLNVRQVAGRTLFVPFAAEAAVAGWGTAPAPPESVRVAMQLLHGFGGKLAEAVGAPAPARRVRRRGKS